MIDGQTLYLTDGETVKVINQWSQQTERLGSHISVSSWAFDGSGTLGAVTQTNHETSLMFTPKSDGYLENTVTLVNGITLINRRAVYVR